MQLEAREEGSAWVQMGPDEVWQRRQPENVWAHAGGFCMVISRFRPRACFRDVLDCPLLLASASGDKVAGDGIQAGLISQAEAMPGPRRANVEDPGGWGCLLWISASPEQEKLVIPGAQVFYSFSLFLSSSYRDYWASGRQG